MEETIQEILRHIEVLNDDYTLLSSAYHKLSIDVAVLKSQMNSLTWWLRAAGAAFVGIFVTQLWQVVLMKKNEKKK